MDRPARLKKYVDGTTTYLCSTEALRAALSAPKWRISRVDVNGNVEYAIAGDGGTDGFAATNLATVQAYGYTGA